VCRVHIYTRVSRRKSSLANRCRNTSKPNFRYRVGFLKTLYTVHVYIIILHCYRHRPRLGSGVYPVPYTRCGGSTYHNIIFIYGRTRQNQNSTIIFSFSLLSRDNNNLGYLKTVPNSMFLTYNNKIDNTSYGVPSVFTPQFSNQNRLSKYMV